MDHLHGAVSLEQFEDAGMSRWTVNRRIRSGDLRRLAGTVAALPGAPDGLLLVLAGGTLAVGHPVCAVGESAAYLRGFHPKEPKVGHLAVPTTRGPYDYPGLDVRRETHFDQIPIQVVQGLPTAGVNWTLMDAARDLTDEELARAIATADRKRATSLDSLARAAELRGRWHGSARFREVMADLRRGHTHSKHEARARRILRRGGLLPHPRPFTISDGGVLLGEVDIPFLAIKLGIEIDGPHHFLKGAPEADRKRDRRLIARGWEILRFTTYEIRDNPTGFFDEVNEAYLRRVAAAA